MKRKWTKEEIRFLEDNLSEMTYAELGEALGRSTQAVKTKMHKCGLPSARSGRAGLWTEEEVGFLEDNFLNVTHEVIGEMMGRTLGAIRHKAVERGLTKSPHCWIGIQVIDGVEKKRCPKCETWKPVGEFHQRRGTENGYSCWCISCSREYDRERERAPVSEERQFRYNLKKNYDISLEDYDEMLASQHNGCAICGRTPEENARRLCVDHDHETGQLRGLLCAQCNSALGMIGDDIELARRLVAYLEFYDAL